MSLGFDEFLREAAPFIGLQWRPFQRRGIKRKVERRIAEIGLSNFEEYLPRIQEDPQEQKHLSLILTVTISRFFRDQEVFNTLGQSIIPNLLKEEDRKELKIWSIGCASGEEPYTLSLLWKEKVERVFPKIRLSVFATDIDENMLERAKQGRYKKSSLKEVPEEILGKFFDREGDEYRLDLSVRQTVEFKRHDILQGKPFDEMDIIFCRNLALTYFSKEAQMAVLRKLATSLKEKGYLVIGKDESLPLIYPTLFVLAFREEKIFQKFTHSTGRSPAL
jgi:chemotaxis protein methyltransferase CheR